MEQKTISDHKPRLFRSFHIQLLLLTIVPLALVSLGVAFGGARLHEEAMRELVASRDARATQAAADNLAERLRQREVALQLVAQLLDEQTTLHDLYVPPLNDLFDYGMLVAEPQGDLVDTWLPAGAWEWRNAAGRTPTYVGHDTSEALVAFSVAVPNSSNYLYGATSLENLGVPVLLESLISSSEARAYLVDQDRHILHDVSSDQIGQEVGNHAGVSAALQGESGFLQSTHEDEDMVVGYSAVSRLGWGLIVEEHWHAVTNAQLRFSNAASLIVMFLILIGIMILVFSVLGVVLPLQRLKVRASQLINGDYEAVGASVGGVQEITALQDALIQMARSVREAQARLHDYIGAITTAQEDERARLARDLHDDIIQSLIAQNQQAQMAHRSIERGDTEVALRRVSELRTRSEGIVNEMRQIIHGLRPSYLAELGLVPALEMLVEQFQAAPADYHIEGTIQRLPESVELAFYRITQEALSNIRKHSQAKQASVTLQFTDQAVTLRIEDNGIGFQLPPLQQLPVMKHYGLLGIQERTQLIRATLVIESYPGKGTTVSVQWPLKAENTPLLTTLVE
ncbi:MAG: hypothetical protein K8I82_19560 [Anaerolineae bacterium]|nr:hypothetical protein [Anaerolineae bacterium]